MEDLFSWSSAILETAYDNSENGGFFLSPCLMAVNFGIFNTGAC